MTQAQTLLGVPERFPGEEMSVCQQLTSAWERADFWIYPNVHRCLESETSNAEVHALLPGL